MDDVAGLVFYANVEKECRKVEMNSWNQVDVTTADLLFCLQYKRIFVNVNIVRAVHHVASRVATPYGDIDLGQHWLS